MKQDDLAPIPIPARQRWQDFRLRIVPAAVFGGALVIIAFLWNAHIAAPTLVGQAEPLLATVRSQKPGLLAELTVSRFQTVKAGDVIGQVIVADPTTVAASLGVIRSEIDLLRASSEPLIAQQRNAVNYAQLRLDWMRQRADLASVKVNFQLATAEWRRSEALFNNKLISESEMDIAKANYSALQQQVEELVKLVAEGESSFTNMQPAGAQNLTHLSNEPMRAAIAVQEANLRMTEAELNPITLKAPIDGVVTMIYYNSGETVVAGQPIVSLASAKSARIVGYLQPPLAMEPLAGDQVQIRTRGRHRVTATATIMAVGAQLEAIPAVFGGWSKINLSIQGLPVNISLPDNLNIRPGELVDCTLISKAN